MNAEPKLSVVIVSYNTCDLLRGCLASVRATQLPTEAIVVDNASTDGSAEMVEAEFPAIHLVRNPANVGFATATNQGIALSRGQYLVLLNPDAEVRPGALEELAAFLDGHPGVAVAGPQLRYPDGSLQHSCFRFPTLLMSFLDFFPLNHRIYNSRLNGRYSLNGGRVPFPVDHPLGACMMVRRTAVEEVGLLDEGFFIYCEEVDWCWRMKKAGWQAFCVPSAVVVHYEAQSTRRRPAMFVELHKSRRRLFSKHRSSAFRWASRQLVRLGVLREMYRCWRSRCQGRILEAEYQTWMQSYRTVLGM